MMGEEFFTCDAVGTSVESCLVHSKANKFQEFFREGAGAVFYTEPGRGMKTLLWEGLVGAGIKTNTLYKHVT